MKAALDRIGRQSLWNMETKDEGIYRAQFMRIYTEELARQKEHKEIDDTLKKLDELSGGDEKKKIAILNQSVMNGWQSVYALHTDKRKNSNSDDIYNDALAMLEQEGVFDDDGQGGNDCNH